jgi:glycosyltransferase involved in cell wall biosynthesis
MPPPLRVFRLCSVFEPPASSIGGRGARFDPVGGMQDHTASLTRELDRRGVVQVVLTARPPMAPAFERIAPRATVVRVALPVRRFRRLYSVPAAVLAPLLGRHADLVHVHLGEDLAILPLAALAAAPHRLPIVLTVHCSLAHTVRVSDARTAVLRTLGGWIERQGERRAAATIVYTSLLADRLARDPGCPAAHVMRRGVDCRLFAGHGGADPFPELRGRPRVVFVGRLVRSKGVHVLLEAASRMRTPGVQIVLVGDGPERARVERQAEQLDVADRVHVTGFVEHHRIPDVLATADLLVLPSTYEELGTVLVEALHAGVPTVASRTGGIPEVVEHGVTGLLVPPGDAGALARAVDTVLSDPRLAASMREAARRRAADYELVRMGEQVHELYERVTAQDRERHRDRHAREHLHSPLWADAPVPTL